MHQVDQEPADQHDQPQRPDLPRSFRTPAVYAVATASVLLCFYLMLNLTGDTWLRFLIWMVIGLVVYFAYGYRQSALRNGAAVPGAIRNATN